MDKKSQKIGLIIVIGILCSSMSSLYVDWVDDLLGIEERYATLNLKLINETEISRYQYFLISIFLNIVAVVNLYIMTNKEVLKKLTLFLLATVCFYILIYFLIYQLTYLTVFISFINYSICFSAYIILMKFIYGLKIMKPFLIGNILLFSIYIVMNQVEEFYGLDFIWFLIITILFPLTIEAKSRKVVR